ncbi:ArsA family ATPase [Bdellovibrio sp. SKB1291214]|uniref:ArsA family ATPase n=1 Tax=Bdellovibrio sp. SKB1291214 TaxID=1732569 RepID=UPI00223FCB1B|nr:ArsA family ATPase [Bdellovibrio sp. SKB1291214]UYL10698.1 ArsA family ATPase [Bdellovibrio sp. SKB1291214]
MKQEIHFVTGKGGVGKSVVAAALALKLSRQGKKVLLVELGDQSFFKDFFELPEVGFKPQEIKSNLSLALWTGESALREYAQYLIKVESLAKLFFDNAVMKAFINIAPGLPELAMLGKITSGPRKYGPPVNFDCLVIDAFATGHFKALIEAPRGMAQAVQIGPMGEQSRSIVRVLKDSEISRYHIVSLPEELPLKESMELADILNKELEVEPQLVMNKVLEVNVPRESLQKAESATTSDLGLFAQYLEQQLDRQAQMMDQAKTRFKNVAKIPLFFETEPWKLVEKAVEKLP